MGLAAAFNSICNCTFSRGPSDPRLRETPAFCSAPAVPLQNQGLVRCAMACTSAIVFSELLERVILNSAAAFGPLRGTDDFYLDVPGHEVDANLFGNKLDLFISFAPGHRRSAAMRTGGVADRLVPDPSTHRQPAVRPVAAPR